ncbi:YcbK family protein [Falsiroseomonas oryzae]|uniref:YcbK family protein n=1 Tax=Falsiroseomonas oryzae TaxID=2766473 RepID=UPI0022EABA25|nr:DUF882 domain-containing protein [Roseomonas sp. MO-31]
MRRTLLFGGVAAFATVILPRAGHANTARRIALRHSGTGARFTGVWHDGRQPDRAAMAELSQVLADPGCTPPRPFDPDAIAIAWDVLARTRFDTEIEVHSGYRTPQVNRAVHGAGDSQHLRASALDIGVPAGRLPAVVDAATRLGRGGVGVYRQRGFVHLDSGPVRSWSDSGGAGGRASGGRDDTLGRIAAEWRRGNIRLGRF